MIIPQFCVIVIAVKKKSINFVRGLQSGNNSCLLINRPHVIKVMMVELKAEQREEDIAKKLMIDIWLLAISINYD